jgi:hypothetical protein
MSRPHPFIGTALLTVGLFGATFADAPIAPPEPKTSTGRELTGPGTHHGEYIGSSSDTSLARPDTVLKTPDSMAVKRGRKVGKPVPGVDDKSSTRPGD